MTPSTSVGDIRLQVMWNRLLSVVEEQARALAVSYTHLTLPTNREV